MVSCSLSLVKMLDIARAKVKMLINQPNCFWEIGTWSPLRSLLHWLTCVHGWINII